MSISSDKKYNVAWFKLAECVSRGEKERALAVYRLLAHSFKDRAFASQLEGDLFSAFGDSVMAKNRYDRAFTLYKEEERIFEMATVAEQNHFIYPEDRSYLEVLIDLYMQLSVKPKLIVYLSTFIKMLVLENDASLAVDILDRSEAVLSDLERAAIRQEFVFQLIKAEGVPIDFVMEQIQKTVDSFMLSDGDMKLNQFLLLLQGFDKGWSARAFECIKSLSFSK